MDILNKDSNIRLKRNIEKYMVSYRNLYIKYNTYLCKNFTNSLSQFVAENKIFLPYRYMDWQTTGHYRVASLLKLYNVKNKSEHVTLKNIATLNFSPSCSITPKNVACLYYSRQYCIILCFVTVNTHAQNTFTLCWNE